MKQLEVESFTMQSFVKSHNIRKNKWFNTEYNGSSCPCTVLTPAAIDNLTKHGFCKIAAPGTDTYNRWPMSAYSVLEDMVNDKDENYEESSDILLEVMNAMKAIEAASKATQESSRLVIERIESILRS